MPLRQSIDQARPPRFEEALKRTAEALSCLRARHADGALPLLRLPERRDDIATILGYAALLRDGTTDVVFLGTGGSSLGGQTLAQLAGHGVPGVGALREPPRMHFMDNLDPDSWQTVLQRLPLRNLRPKKLLLRLRKLLKQHRLKPSEHAVVEFARIQRMPHVLARPTVL